jgi:catechol 2,3-dioxygenase-like lactoylglutathione lyase family enzyme
MSRRETRATGRADPVRQYLRALNEGYTDPIEDVRPGEVIVHDPRAGEIRGHRQPKRFIDDNRSWLTARHARIETRAATGDGGRPVVEFVKGNRTMDMKLEVVVLPVTDVDRAKGFYRTLGWREDADVAKGDDFRVVQMTPPGSPASVIFGTGLTTAAPGSTQGLNLVVDDIEAARKVLTGLGTDVSPVFHDAGGVFHHAGTTGRVAGPAPNHASYGSFASFKDPDGNEWFLQEITKRLPGR